MDNHCYSIFPYLYKKKFQGLVILITFKSWRVKNFKNITYFIRIALSHRQLEKQMIKVVNEELIPIAIHTQ